MITDSLQCCDCDALLCCVVLRWRGEHTGGVNIAEGGRWKQVAADAGFPGYRGLSLYLSLLGYAVAAARFLPLSRTGRPAQLLALRAETNRSFIPHCHDASLYLDSLS